MQADESFSYGLLVVDPDNVAFLIERLIQKVTFHNPDGRLASAGVKKKKILEVIVISWSRPNPCPYL